MLNIKLLIFFLVILFPLVASGQTPICDSKYIGKHISREQLQRILTKHNSNLSKQSINLCKSDFSEENLSHLKLSSIIFNNAKFIGTNLKEANLSYSSFDNADFSKANLQKTNFKQSNLQHTNFDKANLSKSNLSNTNLFKSKLNNADLSFALIKNSDLTNIQAILANFSNTNLTNSIFNNANLTSSNFTKAKAENTSFSLANMQNTDLTQINLTDAILANANLTQANLYKAILVSTAMNNTNLTHADLKKAIYRPKLGFLPNIVSLMTSQNFSTLKFNDEVFGSPEFIELRTAYKKSGIRKMDRFITTLIKRYEMRCNFKESFFGIIKGTFQYICFYLTCDFGYSPMRPLIILAILTFLFAIPYYFVGKNTRKNCGIFVKTNKNNTFKMYIHCRRKTSRLLFKSLYFSIISSFNIGTDNFRISNWIKNIQFTKYTIQAKGWVRSVSGIQTLLGIYFILLWLVTYFGNPFEW